MTLIYLDTALCPLPQIQAPIPFHGASPLPMIMPCFQVQRRKCLVKLMSLSALCSSPFFCRACHLTDWWISIPMWRAAPPLSPDDWPWQRMRSCICYRGDALLASFALAEWKSKWFNVDAKLVNSSGINTLNTREHTHTTNKCHMLKGWLRSKSIKYMPSHKWSKWCGEILCVAPLKPKNDYIILFPSTWLFSEK